MTGPDVIVVGSGPAGVSVAWPLVEAGLQVLMVGGSAAGPVSPSAERPPLAESRRLGSPRWLLGAALEHLRLTGDGSPKLRTAAGRDFHTDYHSTNRIDAQGFHAIGTLAQGGLSTVWGAVVCALDARDLAGWPAEAAAEMAAAYGRVALRTGLSGDGDDAARLGIGADLPLLPPLPPSPAVSRLLARAQRAPQPGLVFGRPVNAVLSRAQDGRGACSLCRGCMWGCHTGAVWSSLCELPGLARHPNFRLLSGLAVDSVAREEGVWVVRAGGQALRAPRVVLAAGALPSTRLALAAAGRFGEWLPVANAPATAFAAVVPSRLGCAQSDGGYGNAQAAFRLETEAGSGFGLLYDGDIMAAADLMRPMPLSRPGAAAFARTLLPALLLGLFYLPGSLSANRARLEAAADGPRLVVQGGEGARLPEVRRAALGRLRRDLRRLGVWLLPGSLRHQPPGAEVHVGASLPMGRETSATGELAGCPGLFIADGAVLPEIPAKHHTLTIMANADRIGRAIAGG